ncbi:C4BPA protein, partial [Hippolais icterina]|nr:C4BPA protein [Hippolais icterina]
ILSPVLLHLGVFLFLWLRCCAVFPSSPGSCPKPDRLPYAVLQEPFLSMEDFPPETEVTFTCRPGYMRVPGMSLTWKCGADLQWSPKGEFCKGRKCPYPGDLENGNFDAPDFTFGSTVTYFCNEGYRIRGSAERTCNIKGAGVDWSGTLPYCERIPCEPPPKIDNGSYEERESYVYQTSVTYRCQGSFSLIGPDTIYCTSDADSNGVWSGPPPECRVVKCDNPTVKNGRKTSGFGDSYTYKNSVVFECNQGYFMIGADVITCEENSAWVPPVPTCEKITTDLCPAPKIHHGVLVPAKPAYQTGESVQVRCNAGCSFPDGSAEMTATCQEQSSWSPIQQCTC